MGSDATLSDKTRTRINCRNLDSRLVIHRLACVGSSATIEHPFPVTYLCRRLERNFPDETESNDIGDSLYQAGQELGDEMDDATFLKQCGIEVDMWWLAEITSQNAPTEVSNYATSLLRIADILTQTP